MNRFHLLFTQRYRIYAVHCPAESTYMFRHLPSLPVFCPVNFSSFYFSTEGFGKSEVLDSTAPSRLDHIVNQESIVTEVFCSRAYCLVWRTEVTRPSAGGSVLLCLVVLHQSARWRALRSTFVLHCLNEQHISQVRSLNVLPGLRDLSSRSTAQTAAS